MTNKVILAICIAVLVGYGISCLPNTPEYTRPDQSTLSAPSQAHIRALKALDELDAIQVHCPSFLDAPLGIKPCPARDILDRTKALIQARVEATN